MRRLHQLERRTYHRTRRPHPLVDLRAAAKTARGTSGVSPASSSSATNAPAMATSTLASSSVASTITPSFSLRNASNFGAHSVNADATQPQAAETPLLPTAQAVCSRSLRSPSSTSSAEASSSASGQKSAGGLRPRGLDATRRVPREDRGAHIRYGGVEPAVGRCRRAGTVTAPASTSDASVEAWAQASNTGAKPSSKEASASSEACWALEACVASPSVHASLLRFSRAFAAAATQALDAQSAAKAAASNKGRAASTRKAP